MIDSELAVCLSRAHGPIRPTGDPPAAAAAASVAASAAPASAPGHLCSLSLSLSRSHLLCCSAHASHGMVGAIQWQLLRLRRQQATSAAASASASGAATAAAFRGCYLGPPVGGALIFKLLKMLQAHTHTHKHNICT